MTNNNLLLVEIQWFANLLQARMDNFENQENNFDIQKYFLPKAESNDSIFVSFVNENNFDIYERVALILALAPHIRPEILDLFLIINNESEVNYIQFGGVEGQNFKGFLPTGQTLFFLFGNDNLHNKTIVRELFSPAHFFAQKQILWLEPAKEGEPFLSGQLVMNPEYVELFTLGKSLPPRFSPQFPAQKISTNLEMTDLVVDEHVQEGLNDILHFDLVSGIRKELYKEGKII